MTSSIDFSFQSLLGCVSGILSRSERRDSNGVSHDSRSAAFLASAYKLKPQEYCDVDDVLYQLFMLLIAALQKDGVPELATLLIGMLTLIRDNYVKIEANENKKLYVVIPLRIITDLLKSLNDPETQIEAVVAIILTSLFFFFKDGKNPMGVYTSCSSNSWTYEDPSGTLSLSLVNIFYLVAMISDNPLVEFEIKSVRFKVAKLTREEYDCLRDIIVLRMLSTDTPEIRDTVALSVEMVDFTMRLPPVPYDPYDRQLPTYKLFCMLSSGDFSSQKKKLLDRLIAHERVTFA